MPCLPTSTFKPPKPSKNSKHSKHSKHPKPVEVVARLNWFGAYAAVQVHESEQCKVQARRLLAERMAEDEKRKRARARWRRASSEASGDNKGLLVGRFIANAVLSRNVEGASREIISRGPLPSLLPHHDQLAARRSALPPISARTMERSSSDTLPLSPLRNVLAMAR